MKKIGFLSFGHWSTSPSSPVRSASDALIQSLELAEAVEDLGADGAYFRVHHFAQQLASPFPLLAACGVAWLAWDAGRMPWIALVLAASFGLYGLMRKTAALGALEGLSFETMLLFPFAAGYVVWLTMNGENSFINTASDSTRWLLVAAGPITAIPLLLFAAGARKIPLSVLGLLQYIGPTIQFALGIFLFHEAFTSGKLVGFLMIWSALALYAAEGLWKRSN